MLTPKPHTVTNPKILTPKNKITPLQTENKFSQGTRAIVTNFYEHILKKTGKQSNKGGTGSLA